jgi:hypothetical protein
MQRPLAAARECDFVPGEERTDSCVSTRRSANFYDGSLKGCAVVDETKDTREKTKCMIEEGKTAWKFHFHSECADVMGRSQ